MEKNKSPKAIALEKTIQDLEQELKNKRNELKQVYEEGPESPDIDSTTALTLQRSSSSSPAGMDSSQFPKGFTGRDDTKYGIHKEMWKSIGQKPKFFSDRHRPIFIEEEEVYQERAKSLPRRKSMAECIDKRILQVDEALRSRVVDTERNRKLGLSGGAKQINVRSFKKKSDGSEIRMAPKIVVGKSKILELHAGNILSHIKTHEIMKNSKGTGDDELAISRIGSERNQSPFRTPSPVQKRKSTVTTIRANTHDVGQLGRKGFTMDGTLAVNVMTGARTI